MHEQERCFVNYAVICASLLMIESTAEVRVENLNAYAAEILVRRNLMIWSAAIYCTWVVRDIDLVALPEPWFTSHREKRSISCTTTGAIFARCLCSSARFG
jgi:hypothetical protein